VSERVRVEPVEEARILRYLLGQLPEQERREIQERCFLDASYFQFVQAVETELLDAYVRGELPANELDNARQFIAGANLDSRLQIARSLAALIPGIAPDESGGTPGRTGGRRWLVLLAAPVAGIIWTLFHGTQPGEAVGTTEDPARHMRVEIREGESAAIHKPDGPAVIAIDLLLPKSHATPPFTIEVRNNLRELVWSQRSDSRGQPPRVTALLKPDQLRPGGYLIEVSGIGATGMPEPAWAYYLVVE